MTALPEGDLIVFDGDCIFCSGFARFMSRHDRRGRFRFVIAQSALGQALYHRHGLDPELMETNIIIVEGRAYTKMPAFAAAMKAIGWPWRALSVLGAIPNPPSDWLYDRIARNRYVFGRRSCHLPSAELRGRLIES